MKDKTSNNEKKKLIKDATDFELGVLKRMRELGEKEVTGMIRQIMIEKDELQHNIDHWKWDIRLKMNAIKEAMLVIKRNDEQITSKKVWRHLEGYPEVLFNDDELKCSSEAEMLKVDAHRDSIKTLLMNLAKYSGQMRIDKKVVYTHDEMEAYIKYIDNSLKELCGKGVLNE